MAVVDGTHPRLIHVVNGTDVNGIGEETNRIPPYRTAAIRNS
jgi:hypothetical protein